MVIPADHLPRDNAELSKLQVDFPRLVPDSPEGCPRTMAEIQDYLRIEDADAESVESRDLTFLRTALVDKTKYWIWEYYEQDGAHCYVTVALESDGQDCLGMDGDWHNLTPEQYILADYHRSL